MIPFLACRHIPYLSNYVSFPAVVEVGAEYCEGTQVTRKSDNASTEVTHLCVPKCKTLYVKTYLYLVPRLRMSGAVLQAFIAWTGTTLP
jgi:hypothetical protein